MNLDLDAVRRYAGIYTLIMCGVFVTVATFGLTAGIVFMGEIVAAFDPANSCTGLMWTVESNSGAN